MAHSGVITMTDNEIDSKAANGKNCAVFHTSAKFGVLIPTTIYSTFSANEYWQY